MNKKYPCYRLDPLTLKRIEIINSSELDTFEELLDPDFETLYIENEFETIGRYTEQTINHKDM